MVTAWTTLIVVLVAAAGCASATLPYQPAQQPDGARLSAAYQLAGDRLRIELDTDGRRLEEARILKADGSEVRAETIDNPPVVANPPAGLGIGIGGGSFGRGGGVGTGVSVGVPVGSGSTTVQGNTFVTFPLAQAGPAPWRVGVKVQGLPPTVILVGGPTTR